MLAALRPLVLVVDGAGAVLDAHGGYGGVGGYVAEDFVGRSVFDFVAPDAVDELASYFIEAADRSADALALPLPFRVDVVDADGCRQPVDVIPTGAPPAEGELRWVVTIVPVEQQTSVSRSLEAEMAGAPRDVVKRMLTAELMVDNASYGTRWYLVDLDRAEGVTVTGAGDDDEVVERIADEVRRGWRPWGGVASGDTAVLPLDELPDAVADVVHARNERRVAVTPIHVDGSLVAAYLSFARVPADFDVSRINSNVLQRIQRLANATALLIARWHDRDRLVAAATRDPLTGLANRDAFADALAGVSGPATLLYVDVDHFKSVNDRYGHDTGDRVLVEISERIADACRPADVVARFGGDEFVVLLEGVDQQTACAIGERILERVQAPFTGLEELAGVTVSVGLAEAVDGSDVVVAADQAMLRAKRAGRGRIVSTSHPEG